MNDWQKLRVDRLTELEQSQRLAITESTTDLVAIVDVDGFFSHVNASGRKLLGLEEDEDVTSLRLISYYDDDSATAFVGSELQKAYRYGASHSEVTLLPGAGSPIPASQVLIAHKDKLGNIEYFSVVLRDISHIRQVEQERQKLLDQLNQSRKLDTIGRLAGGIAHDFNNFITVIMGYAQLCLRKSRRQEDATIELEKILDASRKAASLSSQLLDFSRKKDSVPTILSLNEVIDDSMHLLESVLGEGVRIHFHSDPQLWPVQLDRSQFEQIVMNLAVNAADAMQGKGSFIISTENLRVEPGQSELSDLEAGGEFVRAMFADTGCGIDQAHISQIFDPFFTTKERGKGTGLGLSAVYGAIKQNQGRILVHSRRGRGTTFELLFPRAAADAGTVESATATDEAGGHGTSDPNAGNESILLVEDSEEIRLIVTSVLEDLGYRVQVTENGAHALETIRTGCQSFDLIITDVMMPEMTGIELYHELNRTGVRSKFLLMSGYTDQADCVQELRREEVRLLHKPFNCDQLARTVRTILDAPQAA